MTGLTPTNVFMGHSKPMIHCAKQQLKPHDLIPFVCPYTHDMKRMREETKRIKKSRQSCEFDASLHNFFLTKLFVILKHCGCDGNTL